MSSTEQHVSLELEDGNRQRNGNAQTEVDMVDARVPRAVPELDDDEFDDRPLSTDGRDAGHGVDDGLLAPNARGGGGSAAGGGAIRPRRPSFPAFPGNTFSGNDGPRFVDINGVPTQIPDFNVYQQRKTLAQGMMDLALLSANANQLRYVLETYRRHPYYYPSLIFISLSIIFQVAVGAGLILNGRYNTNDEKEICRANKINNYTVIGIFIVTVVNVFISAFGVADAPPEV